MHQPSVFCLKLQLHFGGDVHEISVPAYGGAEPTVTDLMNVIERNFRVPRALQNLVFHGQELHSRPNEPLSRFGIRNGVPIRLVGRMVPPDKVDPINSQYGANLYQQPYYTQQSSTTGIMSTNQQTAPSYVQTIKYIQNSTVGTQYDPPPLSPDSNASYSISEQGQLSQRSNDDEQKLPMTPNSSNKN